jgi:Lipase (class 3)
MTEYAMDEVRDLVSGLTSSIDYRAPNVRYLCALFAELAYYYIPRWEFDSNKRAKLIPCQAYQTLVASGARVNVSAVLQQYDFPPGFVAADRGVVAVGFRINELVFIGFRGTQFLFDWRVNLHSKLVPVPIQLIQHQFLQSRFHSGFAEEAIRIYPRICDGIIKLSGNGSCRVFMSGHSLGGAVAAIVGTFFTSPVSMFGAPRYTDVSAYASRLQLPFPAVQVRRHGDLVPTVPPKVFGYADPPYEFGTDGSQYVDPAVHASVVGDLLRWGRFLGGGFAPHSIESYRKEIGLKAGAKGAELPLVNARRLTIADVQ